MTQGRELLPGQISLANAVTRPRPGVVEAEVRLRGWDGKLRRVRRSAPTKGQARALAFQAAEVLLATTTATHSDGTATLRSTIETYLSVLERDARVRPQTLRDYVCAVQRLFAVAGDTAIGELTPSQLARHFHTAYQGVPSQHRQAHVVVRGALGAAVADGLIDKNPASEVKGPKKKVPEPRALTTDKVVRLLDLLQTAVQDETTGVVTRLPNVYSDLALLQVAVGSRVGEMAALEWDALRLGVDNVVLAVTGTVVSAVKGGAYRQDFPKTNRSARHIRLADPQVLEMLRRRLRERERGQDRVFPGAKGGWLSPHTIGAHWRKSLKKSELKGWTTHTLRSTYVTRRALQGAPMSSVAAAVGHTSEATTRRYYEAVDPNRVIDAE